MSLRYMIRTTPVSKRILYSSQPCILRLSSIRWNTTTTSPSSSTTQKTLKPSSFAFPTDPPAAAKTQQQDKSSTAPAPDAPDFKATSLIHGQTDKVIAISERACAKLQSIKLENPKDTALQIQVESGGCHGFQYNLHLINLQEYLTTNKDSSDVFVFERDGASIVLDDSSLTILQESRLDYTKELIGSQFKIVDSPYTSTACGCGASFDFDFDKLEQNKKQRE
ncbi:ISA2 [Candida metapsilosis]|uniref:ISA2 n=1 Tax=Candida metapsilosis TaxID=273372 RepID=A0A8H7ZKV9_9ASCO|nr:ISA2 [Candida metapsilosis]